MTYYIWVASHDPQVLKGILSMLLLKILHQRENYGYSVVLELQQLGFHGLAEGTVYPALTRLEAKGLLSSRFVPSNAGPARKYYRPTDSGTAELDRTAKAWIELSANVERVMSSTSTKTDEAPSSDTHEAV